MARGKTHAAVRISRTTAVTQQVIYCEASLLHTPNECNTRTPGRECHATRLNYARSIMRFCCHFLAASLFGLIVSIEKAIMLGYRY